MPPWPAPECGWIVPTSVPQLLLPLLAAAHHLAAAAAAQPGHAAGGPAALPCCPACCARPPAATSPADAHSTSAHPSSAAACPAGSGRRTCGPRGARELGRWAASKHAGWQSCGRGGVGASWQHTEGPGCRESAGAGEARLCGTRLPHPAASNLLFLSGESSITPSSWAHSSAFRAATSAATVSPRGGTASAAG